ncbi:MAG: hypothetical protein WAW37_20790 [Syntrophobacteraceae bacterium]
MELIFYCSDPNDFSLGLLDRVGALVTAERLVACRNFGELQASLLRPEYDLFAAILVVSSRNDLLDLISIGELLRSMRVILVLPDWERETILKGHDLKPRFLTWPAWNSNEVIAVLHKMLRNEKRCQGM